jgi:osmotically-inducible protein OsmY
VSSNLQLTALANLQARVDLQQIITRSTYLSPKNSVQVLGQDKIVVLRGTAVSEDDRQLAEAMLRLSPGVGEIRNEITVQAPAGGQ